MSTIDREIKIVSKIENLPEYALLNQLYIFRNEAYVLDFLERHLFLLPLLLEAPTEIKKYFANEPLILEVGIEPDFNSEDGLKLKIATTLEADETGEKLDQLDENWWLDNLERADTELSIMVEFQ